MNISRCNKKNDFTLKKVRSRHYTTKTITDTDDAGDLALLSNPPVQAECLLYSLKQVERFIDMSTHVKKKA